MDPKQTTNWKNIGRRALTRAGLLRDAVAFHEEPAHLVLPPLLADRGRAQFAFIDDWRMLDYGMVEAFYCDLLLYVGGVIAAGWCPNRHYEPVSLHDGRLTADPANSDHPIVGDLDQAVPGFGRIAPFVNQSVLLLRKTGQDDRCWDYWRDFRSP